MNNSQVLLDDYEQFIFTTWPSGFTKEQEIAHASLGLIGEFCEWLSEDNEARLTLEAGDVLYYLTMLANLKGYHLSFLLQGVESCYVEPGCVNNMDAISGVTDCIKKLQYYGDNYKGDRKTLETRLIGYMVTMLGVLLSEHNLEDVIIQNKLKLTIRHLGGKR